jgi:hypothetical protein
VHARSLYFDLIDTPFANLRTNRNFESHCNTSTTHSSKAYRTNF